MSIPADFRSVIEQRSPESPVYVGPHATAECLVAYDRSYSALLREKVASSRDPMSDAWDQRAAVAFATTERLPYDSTGRIALTRTLKAWAALDTMAMFLGTSETFEIWNPRTLLAMPGLSPLIERLVRGLLAERGESA